MTLSEPGTTCRAALVGIHPGPDRARTLVRSAELTGSLEGYVEAGDMIEVALAEAETIPAARAEALVDAAFFDANRNDTERATVPPRPSACSNDSGTPPAWRRCSMPVPSCWIPWAYFGSSATSLIEWPACTETGPASQGRIDAVVRAAGCSLSRTVRRKDRDIEEALELERLLGQTEGEAAALWVRSDVLSILGRVERSAKGCRGGGANQQAGTSTGR